MTQAVNLSDLLDRSRPAGATALIDCLDWERPREYSFGEIDRLAAACARGLLARGLGRGEGAAPESARDSARRRGPLGRYRSLSSL